MTASDTRAAIVFPASANATPQTGAPQGNQRIVLALEHVHSKPRLKPGCRIDRFNVDCLPLVSAFCPHSPEITGGAHATEPQEPGPETIRPVSMSSKRRRAHGGGIAEQPCRGIESARFPSCLRQSGAGLEGARAHPLPAERRAENDRPLRVIAHLAWHGRALAAPASRCAGSRAGPAATAPRTRPARRSSGRRRSPAPGGNGCDRISARKARPGAGTAGERSARRSRPRCTPPRSMRPNPAARRRWAARGSARERR